jgi:ADP-ribose pyrophosphatase
MAIFMDKTEKTLATQTVFNGRVIHVKHDRVLCPNGQESMREIVEHRGGVAVVAVTERDEIFLVKQYRYALGCEMWEIPAGKLEEGEEPFSAIKRELEEEVGAVAATWQDLGYIIPTCGYCSEKIHLYLAKDLTFTHTHPDEDEFLDIVKLPRTKAMEMCKNGEINDAKTICALARAEAWL